MADFMPMMPVVGTVIISFFGPHAVPLILSAVLAGGALLTGMN